MTKADQLAEALDEFLAMSSEIEAAAVVSSDGLPMASALPPHVEEDRLAAMSAAILTLGERAALGLGKGGLAQVFVEGEDGYIVLMSAGEDAVLVAVTSKGAKVGLLLFEMRRAAERVGAAMAWAPEAPPAPPMAVTEVEGDEMPEDEDMVSEGASSEAPIVAAFGGGESRSSSETGAIW